MEPDDLTEEQRKLIRLATANGVRPADVAGRRLPRQWKRSAAWRKANWEATRAALRIEAETAKAGRKGNDSARNRRAEKLLEEFAQRTEGYLSRLLVALGDRAPMVWFAAGALRSNDFCRIALGEQLVLVHYPDTEDVVTYDRVEHRVLWSPVPAGTFADFPKDRDAVLIGLAHKDGNLAVFRALDDVLGQVKGFLEHTDAQQEDGLRHLI